MFEKEEYKDIEREKEKYLDLISEIFTSFFIKINFWFEKENFLPFLDIKLKNWQKKCLDEIGQFYINLNINNNESCNLKDPKICKRLIKKFLDKINFKLPIEIFFVDIENIYNEYMRNYEFIHNEDDQFVFCVKSQIPSNASSYIREINNLNDNYCKDNVKEKLEKGKEIINSIDNLNNYKGNTDSIKSIVIIGDIKDIEKKTIDFKNFSDAKLSNLKKIVIKYANIRNINSLFKNNLESLEIIGFEECKFEEIDKIDYDKLKNCSNLKYVNFYKNGIINTKLLELFNNDKLFPKVKSLFIGGNLFNAEKLLELKKKNFICHLNKNIKEIGISGNFNEKTNEFIQYFDFNPKYLYINRNELSSLKVLENYKFERLEEFYATANNITDLNELKYLKSKTVKIINLKNNPIKSIDNLEEIIDHFPNLEKLIITFEDYDDIIYKDKIIQIKKKRKNFKLVIYGIKKII